MIFLLQSIFLGITQGFVLDVVTGMTRSAKRKRWLWTDVLFGPVLAVTTFFGALVIMDGQLHPLLLFGVFLGMVTEHVIVGVWIGRILCKLRRIIRNSVRVSYDFFARLCRSVKTMFQNALAHKAKIPKNGEK